MRAQFEVATSRRAGERGALILFSFVVGRGAAAPGAQGGAAGALHYRDCDCDCDGLRLRPATANHPVDADRDGDGDPQDSPSHRTPRGHSPRSLVTR